MKGLIDIEITDVYDPTCGDGGLLSVFSDYIPKFGQEINASQLDVAINRLNNFTGVCADTLKEPAFMDRRFSCIVANPPFSISWEPPVGLFKDDRFAEAPALPPKSKADYAFLLHIIHLLSDTGIAVVLNFPGILYRGNSEGVLRRWIVERNLIEKVIQIPGNTFVDTSIATSVFVIKKNKITTDIEFVDKESGIFKAVSLDEISKNDFTLSVSTYIQKEVEKIEYNPIELQVNARIGMLKKIKSDIEIDKMICEIEGYDFNDYLNSLIELVDSYRI